MDHNTNMTSCQSEECIQGLKLTLSKHQMRIKIYVGEYTVWNIVNLQLVSNILTMQCCENMNDAWDSWQVSAASSRKFKLSQFKYLKSVHTSEARPESRVSTAGK